MRPPALSSPAVVLATLIVMALALYHETVTSLLRLWTDPDNPTYHHGLVWVAVCGYLLYRRWNMAKTCMPLHPSISASVLLLLTSLAWVLASLVDVLVVQQVSLALILALLCVAVAGYRSGRFLALPIALLIFALPIWEPLTPLLQELTAHTVTFLANLTGIPAFLEGTRIWIAAGTFDVEPQCSGLAQLIVGTMAGALFAYINGLNGKTAICAVGTAAGFALIANSLRVYTVLVAGELTAMRHSFITTGHWNLGWVLFGIAMFVYLFLASRFGLRGHEPSNAKVRMPATGGIGKNGMRMRQSALLSLGALAFGPTLLYAYQADRAKIEGLAMELPAGFEGWRAASAPSDNYRPVFESPDYEDVARYADALGNQVYVYVAEYAYQEQGKEAVHYLNRVYDNESWKPVQTGTQHLGNRTSVQETVLASTAGAEKIVWQWYYVHGSRVSSAYMAKLLNAWGTLNQDAAIAVVVVAADMNGSYDGTVALLRRFVADSRGPIERTVDALR